VIVSASQSTEVEHLTHRQPVDTRRFLGVRRPADQLGAVADVDLMGGVDHAGHRLERHEVSERPGPPAGFLLHLSPSRGLPVLPGFDDPAGQFPTPLVGGEAVPPHHQHPILVIEHDSQRHPLQPDHVMLGPLALRGLDIDQRQPDPGVLVYRSPWIVQRSSSGRSTSTRPTLPLCLDGRDECRRTAAGAPLSVSSSDDADGVAPDDGCPLAMSRSDNGGRVRGM